MKPSLALALAAAASLCAPLRATDQTTYQPLRSGHPRLETTAEELEQQQRDESAVSTARASGDAALATTRTRAWRDYVAKLPKATPPPAHSDPWPYWPALCGELRHYMEAAARAYALTGQRKYLAWCRDLAIAISQWPQWTDPDYGDGQPGLDTRELLRAMCLAYDYLYPELNERERAQIARVIAAKGAEPILRYGSRPGSYLHRPDLWPNGYATINAELGVAALTLLGEDDRAQEWLRTSLERVSEFLTRQAGADGGLVEGFALGGAAVDDIVYLLQCAAQVAGIEPPEAPYWAEAIHFPLYFIAPGGGSLANFADAGGPRGCPPYLLRLAQWLVERRQSPEAAWLLQRSGRGDASTARLARPPEHLPLARHFGSVGWVAMRTGWGDADALLAFRAGSADHHNHRDQNSLILAWGREWLLNDPGYQVFVAPYPAERGMDEATVKARNAYTEGTFGHNALLVDGKPQIARAATITGFAQTAALSCVTGDASDCYGPAVALWRRHIASVAPEYYAIFDELRTDGAARSVDLLLHTTPEGRFTVRDAALKVDEQRVAGEARVVGAGGEALVRFVGANPTFTHGRWPACEDYGHFLKVSFAPAAEHRIVWALAAGGLGQARLETRPVATTGEVMAMQVRVPGAVDTLAVNLADGPAEAAEVAFGGRWALVRAGSAGVRRWALVGGTVLRYGEQVLVSSSAPVTVGLIHYDSGWRATVECSAATEVRIHCPKRPGVVEIEGLHEQAEIELDTLAQALVLRLQPGRYEINALVAL